jgi:aryl-alcohol dehydrogenase-like predicted oxidoreductase
LDYLVKEGKVRYIGCSNFTGWQVMKSLAISDKNKLEKFSTLEIRYSLVSRLPEYELIPVCLDQGVAVLAWSPLQGGYLSGKYRRNMALPQGARFENLQDMFFQINPEKLFDIVEELDIIARNHQGTIPQAALNYVLQKPGLVSAIIGLRTADQLTANIKTVEWKLTAEEISRLDNVTQPPQEYPYYTWDPEQLTYEIPFSRKNRSAGL